MDNKVMPKVFMWMCIGLFITFLTGYVISSNERMLLSVFSRGSYMVFIIVEFAIVILLSARIRKMNPTTCKVLFLLYSFITGLTFSSIFVLYKITSIISLFLIASIIFGIFAILGSVTKIDLTKIGTFLFMALISVVIFSIFNIFIASEKIDFVLAVVSLFIFMGITAYDIQKIKRNFRDIPEDNLAIYGAFELYLDYINIFIDLLRIFGKEK
ncbi:MAG: Bax inhibitor-1/YccA family protein [Firmicutes bacterium]|nr:Bax inhibitor-1/YccA family protein [Bacillota bacterium]